MRIVYLAAGAAGMYCGSCLHDNTLAASLRALGEDVLLVPTYTPLRTDEEDVSDSHFFFGGINVFLQQHSAIFRHTPWFLDALLDHPAIISRVARGGPSIEAERLGGLTVSMLEGEHGHQRKEVKKLVRWLEREAKPDVVHLSNTMLVGMAAEIRKLGIPVLSTLSGEDIFLEKIPPPHYEQARNVLRERSQGIDGFVALNEYYADFMADYLAAPRERVHVIPHGLNLEGHGTRSRRDGAPFTIGFLARVCPDKGLHNLVAAAEQLLADPEVPPFSVRVAGYLGQLDRPYLETIQRRTAAWNRPEAFSYVGELSRAEKIAFLQSLDVLALPTVYRESKGLPVLEAWANAVPVVLPEHGAFGEMVRQTGGGLLHPPDDPAALAEALKRLMRDAQLGEQLGSRGQEGVHKHFTAPLMAQRTLDLYQRTVAGFRP
ncbi:MAG: glycosyltransferase family 1 protein [Planctomycetota bacterium]|nr:MAG: glycosyltransferase family 1 protein [Planctomycetota bacterium]